MLTQKRLTDTIAIKKIMIEKGYKTVSSLAADSGISRKTLGGVLDGKIQPSTNVMFKLVDVLDISEADAGKIFFSSNLRNT